MITENKINSTRNFFPLPSCFPLIKCYHLLGFVPPPLCPCLGCCRMVSNLTEKKKMNILTTSLKIPTYSWLWICLISGLPKTGVRQALIPLPLSLVKLVFCHLSQFCLQPMTAVVNFISIQIFFRPFRIHWWLYAHQSQIVWNGIETVHKQPWTGILNHQAKGVKNS